MRELGVTYTPKERESIKARQEREDFHRKLLKHAFVVVHVDLDK
jgi:hypothetical protein